MSKNKLLMFFLFALPAFVGSVLLLIPLESEKQTRLPYHNDKVDYEKIAKLQPKRLANRKPQGPIRVEVELLDDYEEGMPFRLKAKINVMKNVSVANIKWNLSPGVEVVKGVEDSSIYNLEPNVTKEEEITLVKSIPNGAPAKVFFHVTYKEGGTVLTQNGYFSSQHQSRVSSAREKIKKQRSRIPAGMKVYY